jgi:hypothetical protein
MPTWLRRPWPLAEAGSGVDARTRAMLIAAPEQWAALRIEQNRTADDAESAGGRSDALQLAILLAAISLNLAMLAATDPPQHALVARAAAGLLICAGAVTVLAATA